MAVLEKRQTSITPALCVELAAGYEAEATIRELAPGSGAHRETVIRHLVRAGVETRRRGLTEGDIDAASPVAAEGMTLFELAARFEVAANTKGGSLRRRGVPLRSAARRRAMSA